MDEVISEFWYEPNSPGEYQALGLVKAVWFPKGEKSTTGWLLCDQGCRQIESSILGKEVKEFMYSHSDISKTLNYFNVYPRTAEGQLAFQIKLLHNTNSPNWSSWITELEANIDRFRIRGTIRRVLNEALVIHVQQNVKPNKTPNFQFEVELKGEVDGFSIGQFVEVFALRNFCALEIESVELIEGVQDLSKAWARAR